MFIVGFILYPLLYFVFCRTTSNPNQNNVNIKFEGNDNIPISVQTLFLTRVENPEDFQHNHLLYLKRDKWPLSYQLIPYSTYGEELRTSLLNSNDPEWRFLRYLYVITDSSNLPHIDLSLMVVADPVPSSFQPQATEAQPLSPPREEDMPSTQWISSSREVSLVPSSGGFGAQPSQPPQPHHRSRLSISSGVPLEPSSSSSDTQSYSQQPENMSLKPTQLDRKTSVGLAMIREHERIVGTTLPHSVPVDTSHSLVTPSQEMPSSSNVPIARRSSTSDIHLLRRSDWYAANLLRRHGRQSTTPTGQPNIPP